MTHKREEPDYDTDLAIKKVESKGYSVKRPRIQNGKALWKWLIGGGAGTIATVALAWGVIGPIVIWPFDLVVKSTPTVQHDETNIESVRKGYWSNQREIETNREAWNIVAEELKSLRRDSDRQEKAIENIERELSWEFGKPPELRTNNP